MNCKVPGVILTDTMTPNTVTYGTCIECKTDYEKVIPALNDATNLDNVMHVDE